MSIFGQLANLPNWNVLMSTCPYETFQNVYGRKTYGGLVWIFRPEFWTTENIEILTMY